MSDFNYPAIKLFGKTILFQDFSNKTHYASSLHPNQESKEDSSITSEGNKKAKTCSGEEIESKTKGEENKIIRKELEKIERCGRCKSMETKFCYYNNYNVKQPRHFCKKCQRYWTAGGSMRNVPVGAGRRKKKNNSNSSSNSNFRHLILSEAQLQAAAFFNDGLDNSNLRSYLWF